VMLGKNLTMLRTYHKSGALSGLDKLIPHSIDGVTADLMIQDLALTRPFAEIAAHICYPDKPEIKEMYQTHLFVNNDKLFDTDQLSATMSRESISHLGFGLRVNSWRHISTAFKRKLGRFAEELLEEDGQDTVEALQAGHTRATENRIYGLSPDALAGAAEDLLPLFLQASTNWQLLMKTVPGGLELAYTHASSKHFKELAESIYLMAIYYINLFLFLSLFCFQLDSRHHWDLIAPTFRKIGGREHELCVFYCSKGHGASLLNM
jgi:hypothetical protein